MRAAAQFLGMAQPAIPHSIRDAGARIRCYRSSSGTALMLPGEAFITHMRVISGGVTTLARRDGTDERPADRSSLNWPVDGRAISRCCQAC